MIATAIVIGIDVTETVSIATGILTLIAAIVHVLAHLNMTRTLQSVAEQFKIGRHATGIVTALVCPLSHVATAVTTIGMNALAEALLETTMAVSAASVKWSVNDLTLVELIRVSRRLVCLTTVTVVAALRRLAAAVTVTRVPADATARPRYVE